MRKRRVIISCTERKSKLTCVCGGLSSLFCAVLFNWVFTEFAVFQSAWKLGLKCSVLPRRRFFFSHRKRSVMSSTGWFEGGALPQDLANHHERSKGRGEAVAPGRQPECERSCMERGPSSIEGCWRGSIEGCQRGHLAELAAEVSLCRTTRSQLELPSAQGSARPTQKLWLDVVWILQISKASSQAANTHVCCLLATYLTATASARRRPPQPVQEESGQL